jgi:Flp pilus assembly protein TadD
LGFIDNRERKNKQALAYYLKAIVLAERFKSQRVELPMALRGAGYALIDLGQLDQAKELYIKALKLDPGSNVALSELKYIENLQKKRKRNSKARKK